MSILSFVFREIVYRPVFNLLMLFYAVFPVKDLGIALVFATVFLRLAFLSHAISSARERLKMEMIQDEVEELKKRFGHDKMLLAKKISDLYKEKRINPTGSCLFSIFQLLFFIALFQVFSSGISSGNIDKSLIYSVLKSFVNYPDSLNTNLFGMFDLRTGSSQTIFGISIVFLSGIIQYIQGIFLVPKNKPPVENSSDQERFAYEMAKQARFINPLMTVLIGFGLPLGLSFNILVSGVVGVIQSFVLRKFIGEKKSNNSVLLASNVKVNEEKKGKQTIINRQDFLRKRKEEKLKLKNGKRKKKN